MVNALFSSLMPNWVSAQGWQTYFYFFPKRKAINLDAYLKSLTFTMLAPKWKNINIIWAKQNITCWPMCFTSWQLLSGNCFLPSHSYCHLDSLGPRLLPVKIFWESPNLLSTFWVSPLQSHFIAPESVLLNMTLILTLLFLQKLQ